MKPVQQVFGSAMQRMTHASPTPELALPKIEQLLSLMVMRIKALKPAWHKALPSTEAVVAWKREMALAMMSNHITTESQIERAIAGAAADPSPWWPAVGQVIAWAKAPVGLEACFDMMIAGKPGRSPVERATFRECGFACRTQLPVDKARKVFADTYAKHQAAFDRGELTDTPALPASACIDRMHNAEAVSRAGQIPHGAGKAHFDAMRQRLGRATAIGKGEGDRQGGNHAGC